MIASGGSFRMWTVPHGFHGAPATVPLADSHCTLPAAGAPHGLDVDAQQDIKGYDHGVALHRILPTHPRCLVGVNIGDIIAVIAQPLRASLEYSSLP